MGTDPRDEEIKELRNRLNSLETSSNKTSTDNSNERSQAQKNSQPTQRETGLNIEDPIEMKNFLADVMSAISAFDSKLTSQIGQSQTRSDRL